LHYIYYADKCNAYTLAVMPIGDKLHIKRLESAPSSFPEFQADLRHCVTPY